MQRRQGRGSLARGSPGGFPGDGFSLGLPFLRGRFAFLCAIEFGQLARHVARIVGFGAPFVRPHFPGGSEFGLRMRQLAGGEQGPAQREREFTEHDTVAGVAPARSTATFASVAASPASIG